MGFRVKRFSKLLSCKSMDAWREVKFKSMVNFRMFQNMRLRLCLLMIFLFFFLKYNDLLISSAFTESNSFPSVYSWPLCCKLIDHICTHLFLKSLCCSFDLFVFMPIPYCLITITLQYRLKAGNVMLPSLFFFFKDFSGYSEYSWFHTNLGLFVLLL